MQVATNAGTRSFEEEDIETDLDEIDDDAIEDGPFDVYDLNGRKVLHQVTSLDGLPAGIYIVNGRKVMK